MNKTHLEHGGEAEALLYHRDQDRLHWKGKRSGYGLMALPLPQANIASYRKVSPEPTVPPVGKGVGYSNSLLVFWVTSWEPILWSHPQGLLRNLWSSTMENLIMTKRGGESDYDKVSNNQSVEPSWWYIVTRELSGV